MGNWKFNFNLLKSKAVSKLKDFNNMDDSKLSDNYKSHFDCILGLLSANVRKSKGVLVLYTEVDYLSKIILNDYGFIKPQYHNILVSYVQVLCLLKKHISELNGNLTKELYDKLVEFFYYLSSEIHDYENGIVSDLDDSSVKSYKEVKGLSDLEHELNKVRLIKNRSERELELSKWFLEGKGPNLKDLHLDKSVEEVLSEIKNLRDGNFLNSKEVKDSSAVVNESNESNESIFVDNSTEEFDVIDSIIKELENPNLSESERRRLNLQLERNKSFRDLLESDLSSSSDNESSNK